MALSEKDFSIVDLFCGIGGLTNGFVRQGFSVAAGIDFDNSCKYAFEANNGSSFIYKDIAKLRGKDLIALFPTKKKILIGCAPCQPFSSYTFKDKEKDNNKWSLLYHFSRLIKYVKPDIVSMENVAQLTNFKKAPVFEDFVNSLKEMGYYVNYQIINCQEYGIPQTRRRLVLLASKLGEIALIPSTHKPGNYVTVKQAIGHLPPITDGEQYKGDPIHFARKLTLLNKQRIKNTPYGGSWKDWPEELVLDCHKRESGKSYSSVYGRMIWEESAPTITTHCIGYGNGRFGHPEQDRAISLREASLLQTFPETYKFFDEKQGRLSSVLIARQIGNAVPVRLGEVIAESIREHLKIFS